MVALQSVFVTTGGKFNVDVIVQIVGEVRAVFPRWYLIHCSLVPRTVVQTSQLSMISCPNPSE